MATIGRLPVHFRPVQMPLVRLGSMHDGGYVVSRRSLELAKSLVSFGVEQDWSFEADMVSLKGPQFHIDCFDPTVARTFANQPSTFRKFRQFLSGRRHLRHVRIGGEESFGRFFNGGTINLHPTWVGKRGETPEPSLSFHEVLETLNPLTPFFVKMDIEGSEWALLDEIASEADRICGMAIEFHDLGQRVDELAANHPLFEKFAVCNTHANNFAGVISGIPDVLEISFVNRAHLGACLLPKADLFNLNRPNWRLRPEIELTYE